MANAKTPTRNELTAQDHAAMGHGPAGETSIGETHAGTKAHTIATESAAQMHAKPKALGMDATMWVALAMLVVIAIAIWKKVPAIIAGMLDKQIAGIKEQLDKATALREEAEAIKAEYLAKARQAERDADEMRANADVEAQQIVAKAKADASDMITRRQDMAEQKIAVAQADAIASVRANAAAITAAAAEVLIAQKADAKHDASLIDEAIATLN